MLGQTKKSGAKSISETHEERRGQFGWAPESVCKFQRLVIIAALHPSELHDRLSRLWRKYSQTILWWAEIKIEPFGRCPITHTTTYSEAVLVASYFSAA